MEVKKEISAELRRKINIEMAVALISVQHRKGLIKNNTMAAIRNHAEKMIDNAGKS